MRRLAFFLMFATGFGTFAQQDPLHALYLNTPIIINPAYAGFSHDLNLSLNYRKQWAGFEGSPTTVNFSSHIALRENRMGLGLILQEDKIGVNNTTEIQTAYAYHLPISEDAKISFGLQAGFINYKSDYSQLIIDPNDPRFSPVNEWQPNFGAGLMVTGTSYMISVSLPKMLQPSGDVVAQGLYNRSFYGMAAYVFMVSSRVRLRPYALYHSSVKSTSSYDLGVSLLGDDSYVIGLFTRSVSTFGLTAQIKIGERMRLGYAFELPTNNSVGVNFTTHEFQIGFRVRAFQFHDIESVRNF
jgi:type IX secretion system PorP/SprF family membrane protein